MSSLALLADLSFLLPMVLVHLKHQLRIRVLRPQFGEVKGLGLHLGGPLLLMGLWAKLHLKIIHRFWLQNLVGAFEWIIQRVCFFCNVP